MQRSTTDRSLGDLFGDLTRDMGTLVRQEVQLAKTEVTQNATAMGKDLAMMAVGGAIAYAGFLAILAAIVIVLSTLGVPWWLSALLVGIIVAAVGYILIMRGRDALKKTNMAPRQTIETLKEDAEWAKEQTR
jgi:hypothetical protein